MLSWAFFGNMCYTKPLNWSLISRMLRSTDVIALGLMGKSLCQGSMVSLSQYASPPGRVSLKKTNPISFA